MTPTFYFGFCAYAPPEDNKACQYCNFQTQGQFPETILSRNAPTNNQGNIPHCLIKAFLEKEHLEQGDKFQIIFNNHFYFIDGSHYRYYYIQDWQLHHTDNPRGAASNSVMWKLLTGVYIVYPTTVQRCPSSKAKFNHYMDIPTGYKQRTISDILNDSHIPSKGVNIDIQDANRLLSNVTIQGVDIPVKFVTDNTSFKSHIPDADEPLFLDADEALFPCFKENPIKITEERKPMKIQINLNTRFDNSKIWKTSGGVTVAIHEMSNPHLFNTIRMFVLYPDRTQDMLLRDLNEIDLDKLIPRDILSFIRKFNPSIKIDDTSKKAIIDTITNKTRREVVVFALQSNLGRAMLIEMSQRGHNINRILSNACEEVNIETIGIVHDHLLDQATQGAHLLLDINVELPTTITINSNSDAFWPEQNPMFRINVPVDVIIEH